jgi:glycosyltransferase involved in cell wall biosynthesis
MIAVHGMLGTWQKMIDAYVVLTNFSREKFIEGGLPSDKLFLKPNFASLDPGPKPGNGEFALFVGRLSEEKGIRTMLAAWRSLSIPLKIIGDGPLRDELLDQLRSRDFETVEYLGALSHDGVYAVMKQACMLIFPSEWYEGFPLTIAEAFASALPVLASNVGSQAEIVRNGYSGLHFRAGDAADLRERIRWCFQNPHELSRLGANARREYDEKYMPARNYQMLMDIYQAALRHRRR